MKKIRDFPSYRKLQERRLRKSDRESGLRSRSSRRRYSVQRLRREVLTKGLGLQTLPAPTKFSFVNNTEEMIDFIRRLKQVLLGLKSSVIVDFSEVKEVSNDAIILLLSVVQDKRVPQHLKIYVKNPNIKAVATRFKESGIDEHYEIQDVETPRHGRIRVRNSYDANSEMANQLIQYSTRELFGARRKLRNVQRLLTESIANTEEHASGDPSQRKSKMWWGTVFCEKEKGIATFSLLDNGVGIIESLKSEWFTRLPMLARYRNNLQLMHAVFQGNILSSTKLSNRGNGLPAIYKARLKNEFKRLILITNNVYMDFDKEIFRIMPISFSGTFFYWEVINEEDGEN